MRTSSFIGLSGALSGACGALALLEFFGLLASACSSSALTTGSGGMGGVVGASGGLGGGDLSGFGSGGDFGSGGADDGSGGEPTELPPFFGEALPGYTLIGSPENDAGTAFDAFLVDMDGVRVHTWPITGFPPKMLPGGALIGCQGVFPGSYDCVQMQQRSWDGALEWSFSGFVTTPVNAARHHHDFQREGSGIGYYAPGQLALSSGKTLVLAMDTVEVPNLHDGPLRDDVIYEVDAAGSTYRLLWRASEHVDEIGFDEAALADIKTNPEAAFEFLHGNSIMLVGDNPWYEQGHTAFHPDNIVYSSRRANFVAILSHETGEIVWKIGPDFERGPERVLGQFVGQHFAHIVPAGLPGAGNMLVFDNGGGSGFGGTPADPHAFRYTRGFSRTIEFNPITFEVVWEYGENLGAAAYFTQFLGSAQRFPNGNTLLTIGTEGRVIEVTPDKRIVWEYQYEGPGEERLGWVYRAIRVPPEWLPDGVNAELGDHAGWKDLYEDPAPGAVPGGTP